jgi:subfamily B ATP-binding cassette protein MsbA
LRKTFKRFTPYFKEYKFYFFLVLVGMTLTVIATMATAQIMQPLMDSMFIEKDPKMLYFIPAGLIVIYFLKSLGRYIQSVFTNHIGLHIVTRLRQELLSKIIHMDMQYLYLNRSGELISRITNDIGRVQYFVSSMLPEFFREILTVIGLVGYVIFLNPMLSFYALVVMPVVIYPIILIAKRLKKLSYRSQEKNADVVTRLTEVFNNSEIIKANATEQYELDRFGKENWRFFKINMKAVYTNELVSPILELIASAGLAAVIFIGGKEVYDGRMSVGEFTAFLTAVGLVFQPIRRIGSIYGKIQDAVAASERIFGVMDLRYRIQDGPVELDEPVHSVAFENVSLHYGDKEALSGINLAVNSPRTIALVGDSGGGKSSLVNMIIRFYDPSSGSVMINGRALPDYTQASLREQIAIVSQRVYIFQDTLSANVAYGHEIDELRVIEALRLADALDFVETLSDGIHTQMEEFGANLSGGQRQRIAIARAIYKEASLLILDEATSALDTKSEKRIQEALKAYTKDKITIMVAHRLSTVEHADEILVFKAGRIVARGTHDELLRTSSEYQRLAGKMND